ncbi:MAG: zinc ribbon domain-containing protein, partial [Synergistaceae bacterium]|nr:zinc ribbon domain-containing protein [Synergistaceae bacterium]
MSGIFCRKCGAEGNENDIFCRKCGAKHQRDTTYRDGASDDSANFCANCGNLMRQGAKFCDNCASEGGCYAGVHRQAGTSKRGGGSRRRYAFALLFLLILVILAAAAFGAYKYYSGDIDFTEIIAVIKRETKDGRERSDGTEPPGEPSGGAVSFDEPARNSSEEPRNVSEFDETPEPDVGEIQPETGEFQSPADIAPASEDARIPYSDVAAPISEEPAPSETKLGTEASGSPKFAWSEQDAGGYSTLVAPDRFFTSAHPPSAIGVVSGDRVRLRSNHSLKSGVVNQFGTGVSFDVVRRYASGDEKYYWYEVRRDSAEGWIYGEFLDVRLV